MVMATLTSKETGVAMIARELVLLLARAPNFPKLVKHVKGVDNVMPDRLSRLDAPEPAEMPRELGTVQGVFQPVRRATWYVGLVSQDGCVLRSLRLLGGHVVSTGCWFMCRSLPRRLRQFFPLSIIRARIIVPLSIIRARIIAQLF
eukprot:1522239-Amphidinium_carterae.3